jgi:hypothetical protein
MDQEKYDSFVRYTEQGRRKDAAVALQEFVASFRDLEEKRRWTTSYLEAGPNLDKIRHELYEQVIFPVLLEGYSRADPWSLWWLAQTSHNLNRSQDLSRQVEHKGRRAFLQQLHALQPDDDRARLALLDANLDWLEFACHEWPGGILYGMDAANLAQSEEIAELLAETRALDKEGRHAEFLAEFEDMLTDHVARLRAD